AENGKHEIQTHYNSHSGPASFLLSLEAVATDKETDSMRVPFSTAINSLFARISFARPFASAAFLLLAAASGIWAQATLHGTVSDPLGAAVANARVILEHGTTSGGDTTTNAEGDFTFPSVTTGRYRVRVEASGFVSYTGPEIFVGSAGITSINV